MVRWCTYTRTYPIKFFSPRIRSVSAPRIRDMTYPIPNPQPVIIRSAPNPMKKCGIGYGKVKIRSDPFRSLQSTTCIAWSSSGWSWMYPALNVHHGQYQFGLLPRSNPCEVSAVPFAGRHLQPGDHPCHDVGRFARLQLFERRFLVFQTKKHYASNTRLFLLF